MQDTHTQIHQHPRIWMVPYSRNPFFTGREDDLERLQKTLHTTYTVALTQAITGLGGIGKTQTAIEYAYYHQHMYEYVFWVNASSQDLLSSSFVDIAHRLNLPQKNERDQNRVIAAVMNWLRNNTSWLLVIDNADDLNVVTTFLPTAHTGHIILTTRAQAVGLLAKTVQLEQMPPKVGACFLLRRAGIISSNGVLSDAQEQDRNTAIEISQIFGGLPLALDQAGAYIRETKCRVSDYLNIYQQQEGQLLQRRGTLEKNDYPASVATTWEISVQKIVESNLAAIEILRLCTFLHPDTIPEEIIKKNSDVLGATLQPIASDHFAFNQAIKELRNFSLLQRSSNGKILTIHRLVQAVFRDKMSSDEQKTWGKRALRAVENIFPSVLYENWSTCQMLLPHAQVCSTWMKQQTSFLPEGAHLLLRAGYYCHERAQDKEASTLLEQSLKIFEDIYGYKHRFVADCLNNLALVYEAQDKYKEAESLFQRALAIDEVLEEKQYEITSTLNNLANLYQKQGRYPEAETLFLKALASDEQRYGSNHIEVATDLNNLALLYRIQGRYVEAEPLAQKALTIKENTHGSMHPAVAKNLNNLAAIYFQQELYEKAEPLYERALTIRTHVYEADHPEIAGSLNNLSLLYTEQGKLDLSEEYCKKALAIKMKVYGEENVTTLRSQHNLARIYKEQNKYAEAERLYLHVLHLKEKILGEKHVETAEVLYNLALLYDKQGRYNEATSLLLRSLAIFEEVHGTNHFTVTNGLSSLCENYLILDKYIELEPLLQHLIVILEQVYGSETTKASRYLRHLGIIHLSQKRYEEAEHNFLRALLIDEKANGPEHPSLATNLRYLGLLYQNKEYYQQAEPYFRRAITILQAASQREQESDDLLLAEVLCHLAECYHLQERYAEAEPLYLQALVLFEQENALETELAANCMNKLAANYWAQEKLAEAEMYYQQALTCIEKILGPDDFGVALCVENLASLYFAQAKYVEALPLYRRVLGTYIQHLEPENPYISNVRKAISVASEKQ